MTIYSFCCPVFALFYDGLPSRLAELKAIMTTRDFISINLALTGILIFPGKISDRFFPLFTNASRKKESVRHLEPYPPETPNPKVSYKQPIKRKIFLCFRSILWRDLNWSENGKGDLKIGDKSHEKFLLKLKVPGWATPRIFSYKITWTSGQHFFEITEISYSYVR